MSIKLRKIIRANDTLVIPMADSMAHLKQFQLNRSISGILLINGVFGLSYTVGLANALVYPIKIQMLSLYFESVMKVNR